jgi:hypothetical protein
MFGGVDLFKIKVWKKNAFWTLANALVCNNRRWDHEIRVLKEAVP